MDKEQAIKASKAGAIAAFISGGLTSAVVVFAILTNAKGSLGLWNDPAMFFDIFLIFSCGIGMLRYSRSAAIVIGCYFVLTKIVIGFETGQISGIGMALVFLYYFGRAIQGTFVYHRIQKEQNPDYRSAPKWMFYVGIPSALLILLVAGFGVLTMSGVFPSTEVASGPEMRKKDRALLLETGIVRPKEHIRYFYSDGFLSILDYGNILTDQRVIRYVRDKTNGLKVYEFMFDDIEQVKLIEQGNAIHPSIYEVQSFREDAWVRLSLSTEGGGDVAFIEALRNNIQQTRTMPAIQSPDRSSL